MTFSRFALILTILGSFISLPTAASDDLLALLGLAPPARLAEQLLAGNVPQESSARFERLRRALVEETDSYSLRSVQTFFAEVVSLVSAEPDPKGTVATGELLQMLSPSGQTFAENPALADRLLPVLRRLGDLRSPGARAPMVSLLIDHFEPDFDWLEALLVDLQLVKRSSADLELALSDVESLQPSGRGDIVLSVYSMPSDLVTSAEAVAFLEALTAWDPGRELTIFANEPNLSEIKKCCPGSRLVTVPTYGRAYSPWPRDAFTFAQQADASSVVLMRPNLQTNRQYDAELGRALVQSANQATLDAAGGLHWLRSPVPFHNGQILFGTGKTWVSIHSLERRALEILGLEVVPSETFGSASGTAAYLGAVRKAAAEMEVLFGQPVQFVHPLPAPGSEPGRQPDFWLLGGGAGHDLDSLVTILPRLGNLPATLVGSLSVGSAVLAATEEVEIAALISDLDLVGDVENFRKQVAASATRQRPLQSFLDLAAEHLGSLGHEVRRVPLLIVPGALSPEVGDDFLIGVNNAVFESVEGSQPFKHRAEGFTTGLSSMDRAGQEAFEWAGYHLHLLPSIAQSVLRNGGYRCSSNHLRAVDPVRPAALRDLTATKSVWLMSDP